MNKQRCEGWRRHGDAFSFGPPRWVQCEKDAIVLLSVKQEHGEDGTLPACESCWAEAVDNDLIAISEVKEIDHVDTKGTD